MQLMIESVFPKVKIKTSIFSSTTSKLMDIIKFDLSKMRLYKSSDNPSIFWICVLPWSAKQDHREL